MPLSPYYPGNNLPPNGTYVNDPNNGHGYNGIIFNPVPGDSIIVRNLAELARAGDSPDLRVFFNDQIFKLFLGSVLDDKYLSARFNFRSNGGVFLFTNGENGVNTDFSGNISFFIRNLNLNIGNNLLIDSGTNEPFYFYLSDISIIDDPIFLDTIPRQTDSPISITENLIYDDLTISPITNNWQIVNVLNINNEIKYFIEEANGDKIFSCSNLTIGETATLSVTSSKKLYFNLRVRWSIENNDLLTVGNMTFSNGHNLYFNGKTLKTVLEANQPLEITFSKQEDGTHLNQVYFYLLDVSENPPELPQLITESFNFDDISYTPGGFQYNWTLKYLKDVIGTRFIDDSDIDENTSVFSCENLKDNQSSFLTITPRFNGTKYFSGKLNLRWSSELTFDHLRVYRNNLQVNLYSGFVTGTYMGTTVYIDNVSFEDNLSIQYLKDTSVDDGLDSVYFYFSEVEFSDSLLPTPLLQNPSDSDGLTYSPIGRKRWTRQKLLKGGFFLDSPNQMIYLCDGFYIGDSSSLEIIPTTASFFTANIQLRISAFSLDVQPVRAHYLIGTQGDVEIFNYYSSFNFFPFVKINQLVSNITSNEKLTLTFQKLDTITSSRRDNIYFYLNNLRFTDEQIIPLTQDLIEENLRYSSQLNSVNWYHTVLNTLPFIDDVNLPNDTLVFTCLGLAGSQSASLEVKPENFSYFSGKLHLRWSLRDANELNVYVNDEKINIYSGVYEDGYFGTTVTLENASVLKIEQINTLFNTVGCSAVYFYLTDVITSNELLPSIFIDNLTYFGLTITGNTPRRWTLREIGPIRHPDDPLDQNVFFCDGFFNQLSSNLEITIPSGEYLTTDLYLRWCTRSIQERLTVKINDQSEIVFSGNNTPSFEGNFFKLVNLTGKITFSFQRNSNVKSLTRANAYFFFKDLQLTENPLPYITEPIVVNDITFSPSGPLNWVRLSETKYINSNLPNNRTSSLRLSGSSYFSIIALLKWNIVEPDYFNLYQNGIKIVRFTGNSSIVLFFKNLNLNPLTYSYERSSVNNTSNFVSFEILTAFDRRANSTSLLPSKTLPNQIIDQEIVDGIFTLTPQSEDNFWRITSLDENRFLNDEIGHKVILCTESSSLKVKLSPLLNSGDTFDVLHLRWSIGNGSSIVCLKNGEIFYQEDYSPIAYPNNGFSGISLPIEISDDLYEFFFVKSSDTQEANFPINGTFNTFYFFFGQINTLNTGPIFATFKNFAGISGANFISSNNSVRYRNEILYSNNNNAGSVDEIFVDGEVINNNVG